jgi:hypothetical protein
MQPAARQELQAEIEELKEQVFWKDRCMTTPTPNP